ncbi:MAG: hypothetical protein ACPG5B_05445 [Chitinophagales bacterium]
MTSKTLFFLLENLTHNEMPRLADYVHSPFFNKDENVCRLYDFLHKKKQSKQGLEFSFFDKKTVGKYLFPQKEIAKAERKTAALMKKLEQLIFDFLVILKREENSKEDITLLLESLNDRHIDAVWLKVWQKYNKKQEAIKTNIYDFRHAYLLAQNWHEYAILDPKLKLETDLQKVATRFEEYCVAQLLEYACALFNKAQKTKKKGGLKLLSAVLDMAEQEKLAEKQPLIACYKTIVLLLETQEQQYFEELLVVLKQNSRRLDKIELSGIYTIAINYCIAKYRQGDSSFSEHILTLYEQMLENDFLITNHYLAHNHFKNILTIALKFQKIAWAKQFVATYGKRLNPDIRKDMIHFCKGIIAFYEKKYEAAQSLLLQVNEFNFVYHLNKETLLLKVFYVCKYRFFISKLDTFKSYLRQNKKLTSDTRTAHHNFCKALKTLENIRTDLLFWKTNEKKQEKIRLQAEKLTEFLLSDKNIAEKSWLLEQNNVLISKM